MTSTCKTFDEIIPEFIIIDHILPYLESRKALADLSLVSKKIRNFIFSKYCSNIWDKISIKPFEVCIDSYCPNCHFKNRASASSALQFMSYCPIKRIQMHCFLTDIPVCLESLAIVGMLEYLEFIPTNKTNSPPLERILCEEKLINIQQNAFSKLTELSIDSSHLIKVFFILINFLFI
jgi:hypothetical protein